MAGNSGFLQKIGISKNGMLRLFLSIAFPIHLWAILLFFRDFEWIANRSSSWDAVGVGAYSLTFALIETSLVFIMIVLMGSLLPKFLAEERRILLLTLLFYCFAGWKMLRKVYAIANESNYSPLSNALLSSNYPYAYLILGIVLIVTLVFLSVIGTIYLTVRNDRFVHYAQLIIDRVMVLSMAYLFIDAVGIMIVIIRNV